MSRNRTLYDKIPIMFKQKPIFM